MIRAAVFDLDGVIRHFDASHEADVEQRYGLASGALAAAAFAPGLGVQAVTGRMSRKDWVVATGKQLGAPDAAAEWLGRPGTIDADATEFIEELRGQGLVVALLTNGTDEIPRELAEAGLEHSFDHVFNTADIGIAKPDPAVYLHVTRVLGVDADEIFFTDDSRRNVDAAIEFGWQAELFKSVEGVRSAIRF